MAVTEEQAVIKATPHLKEMCWRHWCNLEFEDRVAETQFVFVSALRRFSTNSGHFMDDFKSVAIPYMNALNRRTPSLRYGMSLDANMRTKTGGKHCNAHCFLRSQDHSEGRLYVKLFLESLPPEEQSIIQDLLDGDSKASIAKKYDLTAYQLNSTLTKIGNRYLEEYGLD